MRQTHSVDVLESAISAIMTKTGVTGRQIVNDNFWVKPPRCRLAPTVKQTVKNQGAN